MNLTYAYVVDEAVFQLFASSSSKDRRELLRVFDCLGNDPFQRGDYIQKTASFRELQVKRFGKWLISYWPDHGSCELRIVELRRLVP